MASYYRGAALVQSPSSPRPPFKTTTTGGGSSGPTMAPLSVVRTPTAPATRLAPPATSGGHTSAATAASKLTSSSAYHHHHGGGGTGGHHGHPPAIPRSRLLPPAPVSSRSQNLISPAMSYATSTTTTSPLPTPTGSQAPPSGSIRRTEIRSHPATGGSGIRRTEIRTTANHYHTPTTTTTTTASTSAAPTPTTSTTSVRPWYHHSSSGVTASGGGSHSHHYHLPATVQKATRPHQEGVLDAKGILYARLNAKSLSQHRIIKDPESQKGAICLSPTTLLAYKIVRVLQSAIYGGVFEAEVYSVPGVISQTSGGKPEHVKPRVALKIMLRNLELKHREVLQENICAEAQFGSIMRGHKNILTYDEQWESHNRGIIYVVMPLAEFEDLFEVLKKRAVPFSESEARWLFRQVLDGARYLHQKGVGFRDHSLENILMFRDPVDGKTVVPKITDPGQAIKIKFDSEGRVVERHAEKLFGKSFRPPEVYREPKLYNPVKVDVFCLGWMLFFTVTKRQPFDRTLDNDPHWPLIRAGKMAELLRIKGNARMSPELMDLLLKMMHPDHRQRPDLKECLHHPWFTSFPETPIEEKTLRGPVSAQVSNSTVPNVGSRRPV